MVRGRWAATPPRATARLVRPLMTHPLVDDALLRSDAALARVGTTRGDVIQVDKPYRRSGRWSLEKEPTSGFDETSL